MLPESAQGSVGGRPVFRRAARSFRKYGSHFEPSRILPRKTAYLHNLQLPSNLGAARLFRGYYRRISPPRPYLATSRYTSANISGYCARRLSVGEHHQCVRYMRGLAEPPYDSQITPIASHFTEQCRITGNMCASYCFRRGCDPRFLAGYRMRPIYQEDATWRAPAAHRKRH